jgi:hypothetical protein
MALSNICLPSWADNDACTVVSWDEKGYVKPYIPIRKPGKYCLDRDYSFTCSPFTHSCMGQFVDIHADNVEFDLRGHTLKANNAPTYDGIWAIGKNITIRNGKMSGVGTGVLLKASGSQSYSTDFFKREALEENKSPSIGKFLLENLTIEVNKESGRAVKSSGGNVVLKGNHLTGTIMIYGPDTILEGNQIKLDARDYNPGQRINFRYGLLARNADRIKIVNNEFIMIGDRTATTAIAIWDTQDAMVLNNRISGAETPLQTDNSTVKQHDNKIER